MATIPGGVFTGVIPTDVQTVLTGVGSGGQGLLTGLLTGSTGGSATIVGGSGGGSAALFSANGPTTQINGQAVQQVLTVLTGLSAPLLGANLNIGGGLTATVSVPAGISMGLSGPSTTLSTTGTQAYLTSLVNAAIPADATDPFSVSLRESLTNAVDNITNALASAGVTNVVVRVVQLTDDPSALGSDSASRAASTGSIVFDAGSSSGNEVLAFTLGSLKGDKVLELRNVENAVLVGKGSVAVGDSTPSNIQGDNSAQSITGGGGNDTLVGGGGNDTLVGGGGNDLFGFTALGQYTVSDFNRLGDKISFELPGINSLAELVPFITKYEAQGNNTLIEFVNGAATITLVGVSPGDITADMVKFTL